MDKGSDRLAAIRAALVVSEPSDRADVVARIRATAWDEGRPCEHCGGSGFVPGGRRLVHALSGAIGCDWGVDEVVALVERADVVSWSAHWLDHDLAVQADSRLYRFEVKAP